MARGQLPQGLGQIMAISIMGQVNHANGALVILAQRLTQHAPQRAHSSAGCQQPQRPGLPVRIVVQRAAAQLAQAQWIAGL